MPWVAAAIVGAAAVGAAAIGAVSSSNAARSAANTQADAAKNAANLSSEATQASVDESRRQYDLSRADTLSANTQAREDLAPWRQAGVNALNTLRQKMTAGPGDYTQSPGYDFRLSEGNKAIERSAAARGNVLGGATLKALSRYNQDYATSDYDNFLRRYYESLTPLQSMAGLGQSTASQTAAQGNQVANSLASLGQSTTQNITNAYTTNAANQSNALLQGAQAQAAGSINQANALTGAANSGFNNYLMWQYFNPSTPKTVTV